MVQLLIIQYNKTLINQTKTRGYQNNDLALNSFIKIIIKINLYTKYY